MLYLKSTTNKRRYNLRKIVSLITTCLIFVLGVYFIYNYNKEDITINSVTLDNTLKKEKTSINTTGGICLLGIIDKDKDGLCTEKSKETLISIASPIFLIYNICNQESMRKKAHRDNRRV